MAHHENSHDDHGHDMTEGNRQYYPQGWHLPLIGLFIVAFFFCLGAGALLGISGTDKWGKTEQHDEHDHGHDGEHMEGGHDDDHGDAGETSKHPGHEPEQVMDTTANLDSAPVAEPAKEKEQH